MLVGLSDKSHFASARRVFWPKSHHHLRARRVVGLSGSKGSQVPQPTCYWKSVGEPDYSKGHEYPSALTFKFHDEEDDWMIIWWWQIHVLGSHGFSRIPKVHFSDLARCIFQMKQDVFLRCSKMYFSDMINFEAQLRFGNERSYLGPNTFAPKLTRLRHLPSFCRLTSVCKLYFLVSWRPGRFC